VLPEACVVPFNVIVLASLDVNTTEPTLLLQFVLTIELAVNVTNVGLLNTTADELAVQPFASVTLTV
jgi:hypothetical protein